MQSNVTYVSSECSTWKRTKLNNVIESLNCFVSNTTNDKTEQEYGTLSYTGKLYKGLHIQGDKKPKTVGTPVIYNGIYLGKIDGNGELVIQNATSTGTGYSENSGYGPFTWNLHNYVNWHLCPTGTTCTSEQYCQWTEICTSCTVTNCCWYRDYTSWCTRCTIPYVPYVTNYPAVGELECPQYLYMSALLPFANFGDGKKYVQKQLYLVQAGDNPVYVYNYGGGRIVSGFACYNMCEQGRTCTGVWGKITYDYCVGVAFCYFCNDGTDTQYSTVISAGCYREDTGSYSANFSDCSISEVIFPSLQGMACHIYSSATMTSVPDLTVGCCYPHLCSYDFPDRHYWVCYTNGLIYTNDPGAVCGLWCDDPDAVDKDGCPWTNPYAYKPNDACIAVSVNTLFSFSWGTITNVLPSSVRYYGVGFCKCSRCYDWLCVYNSCPESYTSCVHLNMRYY